MKEFYRVGFVNSTQENYFQLEENARYYLLDSYCTEYNITDPDEIDKIADEIGSEYMIDGYGHIDECYFED